MLHAIVDRVVDDYGPAIEGLEAGHRWRSRRRSSRPSARNPAERIYRLKREVLQFLRATVPLIDPVDRLARGNYGQVHPEVRTYFRDVNDHLIRARDQLEGLNDLLTSVLQANLTQVERAPERGHAQDLGLRRDGCGPDR